MQILKNIATLALAVSGLTLASTALAQQKLIPAQSEITFVSKQMGVPVDGRFKKFDAQIAFDPAKPAAANIAFTVDTGSATVGSPDSDSELPKATWFSVAKFPQATFQSSAVKGLGAGKFQITGKLSIKGNVRDIDFPVALTQAGGVTTVNGQFTLKRLAFKIGENEWADTSMVADDVLVKVKLALSGVGKL